MKRILVVLVLATAVLQGNTLQVSAGDKERTAEINWVKRSTAEFLNSFLEWGNGGLATTPLTFLAPDLAADEKECGTKGILFQVGWQYHGAKFRIVETEMAPNGSEIIVRGELIPLAAKEREVLDKKVEDEIVLAKLVLGPFNMGPKQTRPADFTIRVARDSPSARWLIRSINVKARVEVVPLPTQK